MNIVKSLPLAMCFAMAFASCSKQEVAQPAAAQEQSTADEKFTPCLPSSVKLGNNVPIYLKYTGKKIQKATKGSQYELYEYDAQGRIAKVSMKNTATNITRVSIFEHVSSTFVIRKHYAQHADGALSYMHRQEYTFDGKGRLVKLTGAIPLNLPASIQTGGFKYVYGVDENVRIVESISQGDVMVTYSAHSKMKQPLYGLPVFVWASYFVPYEYIPVFSSKNNPLSMQRRYEPSVTELTYHYDAFGYVDKFVGEQYGVNAYEIQMNCK